MKIPKVSTVMCWLVRLTTFVEFASYVFFGISSAIGLVYYLNAGNAHAVMECFRKLGIRHHSAIVTHCDKIGWLNRKAYLIQASV